MPRSNRELDQILALLGRCLEAIGEYRSRIVLTGGLVPVAYRHLDDTQASTVPPLLTGDVDLTVSSRLELASGASLDELLRDAGFDTRMLAAEHGTVVKYILRPADQEAEPAEYVEFLTPLAGSTHDRAGQDRGIQEVQPGLQAQALRYLNLLLEDPIEMDGASIPGLGVKPGTVLRVPDPATYVLQKLLARKRRQADRRGKDLAYVYDVALLFRGSWPRMRERIRSLESSSGEYEAWVRKARTVLARLFASPTDDGPIEIAHEYSDSGMEGTPPNEDAVWAVMRRFIAELGLGNSS